MQIRVIVATGLNDGDAEYKNMGDVAMLQVAVARLLKLWPEARIEVLTDSPAGLARYCPAQYRSRGLVAGAGSMTESCWVGCMNFCRQVSPMR